MKKLLISIVILSISLSVCLNVIAASDQMTQTNSQLNRVVEKITHLKQDLITVKHSQAKTTNALKKVDLRIASAASQLRKTNQALNKKSKNLEQLRAKQEKLQLSIAKQRVLMADQIRILYRLMQQDPIKVVFSQSDSRDMNRILVYYRYFNEARDTLIQTMRTTLLDLHQNEQAIAKQAVELKHLQQKQRQHRNSFSHERHRQEQLLHVISQQLRNKQQRLKALNQDKKALSQLLNKLQKASQQQVGAQFLLSHKGKLAAPTKGQLVMRFSDRVSSQSNLTLHGVIIKAPAGQSVKAIAPGKVVFANWLRGMGLLLIIDHGGDYMSLYGHNQTLNRSVGEQVTVGDTIATVGRSGGERSSGLYFALRHRGIAINPSKWCQFA